jgi:hypothetical protein
MADTVPAASNVVATNRRDADMLLELCPRMLLSDVQAVAVAPVPPCRHTGEYDDVPACDPTIVTDMQPVIPRFV